VRMSMPKCVYCGIGFTKWSDYNDHKGVHVTTIQPLNTSGRTKAEIVADAERTWLRSALVGSEHLATCKCYQCWLKFADQVIKNQEGLL